MSARERERGELPSPNLSLPDRKIGQGLFEKKKKKKKKKLFSPGLDMCESGRK
jgi:hypothetical protein